MTAVGYVGGDPRKLDAAGYVKGDIVAADVAGVLRPVAIGTNTEVLTVDTAQAEDLDYKPGGGGSGTSVKISGGTPNTSGNITPATGLPYTQIDSDVTMAVAVGDVIGITIEALINDSGSNVILDVATRIGIANVNFVSSGTNTPLFNGARPPWFVAPGGAGEFPFVGGEVLYRVQAGDISGGNVTFRPYAACEGTARAVFRNAAFPLRVWYKNYGQGI